MTWNVIFWQHILIQSALSDPFQECWRMRLNACGVLCLHLVQLQCSIWIFKDQTQWLEPPGQVMDNIAWWWLKVKYYKKPDEIDLLEDLEQGWLIFHSNVSQQIWKISIYYNSLDKVMSRCFCKMFRHFPPWKTTRCLDKNCHLLTKRKIDKHTLTQDHHPLYLLYLPNA